MPLDPHVKAIIEAVARLHSGPRAHPGMQALGAQAARALYERQVRTLDIAEIALDSVIDHRVSLKAQWALDAVGRAQRRDDQERHLLIRQYCPEAPSWVQAAPALLFMHGGGFTIGSVNSHDRLCRMLAREGQCQVFSLDYRLAPETRFPGAVDDAFAALAWLRETAHELGADGDRLAVGGDSAGGTLAAACALFARDQGWPLRLQVLIYPGLSHDQDTASHHRLRQGYLLDADLIQWFFAHYLRSAEDRLDWRFSPLQHPDLARLAPVWMAHAEYDPLCDEGLMYAARLRQAGVPVSDKVYAGMVHAFFQHAGAVRAARQAHQDCALALREAFNPA